MRSLASCPSCGNVHVQCRAHDDTNSSDSYQQGFSITCQHCGYEDSTSKRGLFSGDTHEGHVIIHDCPFCGTPWNEHG